MRKMQNFNFQTAYR